MEHNVVEEALWLSVHHGAKKLFDVVALDLDGCFTEGHPRSVLFGKAGICLLCKLECIIRGLSLAEQDRFLVAVTSIFNGGDLDHVLVLMGHLGRRLLDCVLRRRGLLLDDP